MTQTQMVFPNMTAQASPPPKPRPVDHDRQNRNAVFSEIESSLSETCRRVAEFLEARGSYGATRDEIAAGLRMQIQTVCGRTHDLKRNGLAIPTPERRATAAGRPAVVLVHWKHAKESAT